MDCEEEDSSSLLSLSHTLLQAEGASSSGLADVGQHHSWPVSSSTVQSDMNSSFSPVSPAGVYDTSAGHTGGNNQNGSLRLYSHSRSSDEQSDQRVTTTEMYASRHSSTDNLLNQGGTNLSTQNSGVTDSLGFTEGSTQESGIASNNMNLYYGQSSNFRDNTSDLYDNSTAGTSTESFESHHLSGMHNSSLLTSDAVMVIQAQSGSKKDGSARHSHMDHGPVGSSLPGNSQQTFSNSRSVHKSSDYMKDTTEIFDHNSGKASSGINQLPASHEVSFDRRQLEMGSFDNDFDFTSGARDFSSCYIRMDSGSTNRLPPQHLDYRVSQSSQGNMETNSQSFSTHTYTSSSPHTLDADSQFMKTSLPGDADFSFLIPPKRAWYMNVGFSGNPQGDGLRFPDPQKKQPNLNTVASVSSDLEHLERMFQIYQSTGSQLKSPHELHKNLSLEREEEEPHCGTRASGMVREDIKRSGRSRPHRKITLLLGDDHRDRSCDIQNDNQIGLSQGVNTSVSFQDGQKEQKAAESGSKYSYQENLYSNVRALSSLDEEERKGGQHSQRGHGPRGDESSRHSCSQREVGIFQTLPNFSLDHHLTSQSMPKDLSSSLLSNQQFLSSTAPLDLDFQPTFPVAANRDLDINSHLVLQVSKDLEMDSGHGASSADDLCFDHPGESQQAVAGDLSLPDSFSVSVQNHQDLNLDSYFNTASDRDFGFGRKLSNQGSRNDMNNCSGVDIVSSIEEYMNSQTQRDLSYFDRSHVPQNMTVYSKVQDRPSNSSEVAVKQKGREFSHPSGAGVKQGEMSELQKELTKTSTKESMKGIRIPRDINRALGILQDLQDDEKAEERRKEQEQQKQQQEQQHQQQLQQAQLQQQQQFNNVSTSPKKSFQAKHQVDTLGLPDTQFLNSSTAFGEDQQVSSEQFFDQAHMGHTHLDPVQLGLPDQEAVDGALMGKQGMLQYPAPFTSSHQHMHGDSISTGVSGTKRNLQQNSGYPSGADFDYHCLKRLGFTASAKDTTSVASMLTSSNKGNQEQDFNLSGISRFNEQPAMMVDDNVSTVKSFPLSSQQPSTASARFRQEFSFDNMDFEPRLSLESEKIPLTGSVSEQSMLGTEDLPHVMTSKREAEVLAASRQSLYSMMKLEQFCDAVISTPKQTVKVHQAVLCSLSQYLCTLLHKMQSSARSSPSGQPLSSPASHPAWSPGVLLVINCDSIKSSSLSAFLVYIYLGKAEFCESNVVDLYILACSLRISTLKDLCKEFMWGAQISEDQIKIPQLLVSSQRPETRDQACSVNLDSEVLREDKSVNTVVICKNMEAATQTDRSTSEAGGGGQEEWVMLKKTKQKTVSPSKGRYMSKSVTGVESPFRGGKKGWLSPKRPGRGENSGFDSKLDKESPGHAARRNEHLVLPLDENNSNKLPENLNSPVKKKSDPQLSELHQGGNSPEMDCSQTPASLLKVSLAVQPSSSSTEDNSFVEKSGRTTVEIAAAAAAAKMSAHSYGTRYSGKSSSRIVGSYAALASGLDRRKCGNSMKERPKSSLLKKKDFAKHHTDSQFTKKFSASARNSPVTITDVKKAHTKQDSVFSQPDPDTKQVPVSEHDQQSHSPTAADSSRLKLLAKKPFKKNIAHRSLSEELLVSVSEQEAASGVSESPQKSLGQPSASDRQDKACPVDGDSSLDTGTAVGTFIASIVNTINTENLQKVIRDLDSELAKCPSQSGLTTDPADVSPSSNLSPSKSESNAASASSLVLKPRPQGFRKRLIQLATSSEGLENPESLVKDPQNVSTEMDKSGVLVAGVETVLPADSNKTGQNRDTSAEGERPMEKDLTFDPVASEGPSDSSLVVANNKDEHPALCEEKSLPGTAGNAGVSTFCAMTDRELGLREDDQPHFHHKIFKRQKKSKVRKCAPVDTEGGVVRGKGKKSHASDSDGGGKNRQRKAHTGDTDNAGTRTKVRKGGSGDGEGVVRVRPPPKKRAKMEMELLKAATVRGGTLEGNGEEETKESKLREEAKAGNKENEEDGSWRVSAELDGEKSEDLQREKTGGMKKTELRKKTSSMKKEELRMKSARGKKTRKLKKKIIEAVEDHKNILCSSGCEEFPSIIQQLSPIGFSMESQLTAYLGAQAQGCPTDDVQFTCKLCGRSFCHARRLIKHMQSHGLEGEAVIGQISVEEKEKKPIICDICGFVTKGRFSNYIHYHKYFKHKVPLPQGWTTSRCESCGKECFTKFQLQEHILSEHSNHKFMCWLCGQSFKSRNNLNSHVFHKHSSLKKHECKVCRKPFKTFTKLKVHFRTHTGEKPFACMDCGYRSTTQGNMKSHFLTAHAYSKESVLEKMKKICSDTPELDPSMLEKKMDEFVNQKRPDLAAEKKNKSLKRKKKLTQESSENDGKDKSPKSEGKNSESPKESREAEQSKRDGIQRAETSCIRQILAQPVSCNKQTVKKALGKKLSEESSQVSATTQEAAAAASQTLEKSESANPGQVLAEDSFSLLLQQSQSETAEKADIAVVKTPATTDTLTSMINQTASTSLSSVPVQTFPTLQVTPSTGLLGSSVGYTVISTHILPSLLNLEASAPTTGNSSAGATGTVSILMAGQQPSFLPSSDNSSLVQNPISAPMSEQPGLVILNEANAPSSCVNAGSANVVEVPTSTSLPLPNATILIQDISLQDSVVEYTDNPQVLQTCFSADPAGQSVFVHSLTPEMSQSQPVSMMTSYQGSLPAQPTLMPVTSTSSVIIPGIESGNFLNFPENTAPTGGALTDQQSSMPAACEIILNPVCPSSSSEALGQDVSWL